MKIRDIGTPRLTHSVAEAGTGAPLLLLHGFTGAKEDFEDFIDRFAEEGRHVVAPDHRGHGSSDKPEGEDSYSLAIMAADALALADALGWERFDLLGHSMGGMVAQVMALTAPERIASLVLMDTAPGIVEGIDPELVTLAVAVVRSDGIEVLMKLAEELDDRPKSPADLRVRAERSGYIEFGERKMLGSSPAMYAAMVSEILSAPDRCEALGALDVHTLVVVGEQDEQFLAASGQLADAMADGQLEVIPDAAHSPQFENPERWWKIVSGFLG